MTTSSSAAERQAAFSLIVFRHVRRWTLLGHALIGADWFNWYNWFQRREKRMDNKIVENVPAAPADSPRAHWPEKLRQEFDRNQFDGTVGNVLVSETDDVRVWHLSLPPGGWLTFS
jgi:hypothetical protein